MANSMLNFAWSPVVGMVAKERVDVVLTSANFNLFDLRGLDVVLRIRRSISSMTAAESFRKEIA